MSGKLNEVVNLLRVKIKDTTAGCNKRLIERKASPWTNRFSFLHESLNALHDQMPRRATAPRRPHAVADADLGGRR
jgi:hypothetical protein